MLLACSLQAQRVCRIAESGVYAVTAAVIPEIAGSHRLLLVEMIPARLTADWCCAAQQHGGFCSEKLCRCSLQLCCSAISGTTARSLLLGLRHVLFTLVYLISWRKSCMALTGLLLAVAALQLVIRSTYSNGSGPLRNMQARQCTWFILDIYVVVMLCFKFVSAVLCGILRCLLLLFLASS